MKEAHKAGGKGRQKREFPHVYVILLAIVLFSFLLTHILKAGEYDRVEVNGRMVVDAESYHLVEGQAVTLFGFFQAVPKGLVDTANIIFFIFIVGGSFAVLQDTGAIKAALRQLASRMQNRSIAAIPIIMLAFGFAGAVIGMAEETLPFIPIVIPLMESIGFDAMTGAIVVLCGTGAGFASAFMNPFTIGIAQGIAGLPMFSALPFRAAMFCAVEVLTICFVCHYAKKHSECLSRSSLEAKTSAAAYPRSLAMAANQGGSINVPFTARHKVILAIFVLTLVVLVAGVIMFGWYMTEISALFFAMSMAAGAVSQMGFNGWANSLARGMEQIASSALIVGFAKAIPIVLQDGKVLDTILYGGYVALKSLPRSFVAIGMYAVQCVLNFFIPSGGGQAAVSMPIMSELSDMVGITRQTAVVAFQLGDGISNVFFPTSGYFMAGLALANIPWQKWAKAVFPLIIAQYALGALFVLAAQALNLGPF